MRKLVILSLSAFAIGFAMPAFADSHSGGKGGMFEKHDTNGDGVISKSEFLSHAEERFATMDADGDGSVSKDEAKSKHKEMREKMKERVQERRNTTSE